jgi:hypothetical protein
MCGSRADAVQLALSVEDCCGGTLAGIFGMETHAPAAAEDSVVALHERRERLPRRLIKSLDRVRRSLHGIQSRGRRGPSQLRMALPSAVNRGVLSVDLVAAPHPGRSWPVLPSCRSDRPGRCRARVAAKGGHPSGAPTLKPLRVRRQGRSLRSRLRWRKRHPGTAPSTGIQGTYRRDGPVRESPSPPSLEPAG